MPTFSTSQDPSLPVCRMAESPTGGTTVMRTPTSASPAVSLTLPLTVPVVPPSLFAVQAAAIASTVIANGMNCFIRAKVGPCTLAVHALHHVFLGHGTNDAEHDPRAVFGRRGGS